MLVMISILHWNNPDLYISCTGQVYGRPS